MPRSSRAVAVGYPHHVTQRGNNREPVFFDDADRFAYLEALNHYTRKCNVAIWAYCLMPNHVHLLVVPHTPDGLARGIGLTNQRYTRYVNRRYFRSGRIWQNRFHSCIVDTDRHLWAVACYIENNPVKAGLAETALDYRWSSVHHHLGGKDDPLLSPSQWLTPEERDDYRRCLAEKDERMAELINKATISGRALCQADTLVVLQKCLGRSLS
ncbi:MAG: REP-associated tyrosine transposase [Desulfuromonadales bacterium]